MGGTLALVHKLTGGERAALTGFERMRQADLLCCNSGSLKFGARCDVGGCQNYGPFFGP